MSSYVHAKSRATFSYDCCTWSHSSILIQCWAGADVESGVGLVCYEWRNTWWSNLVRARGGDCAFIRSHECDVDASLRTQLLCAPGDVGGGGCVGLILVRRGGVAGFWVCCRAGRAKSNPTEQPSTIEWSGNQGEVSERIHGGLVSRLWLWRTSTNITTHVNQSGMRCSFLSILEFAGNHKFQFISILSR